MDLSAGGCLHRRWGGGLGVVVKPLGAPSRDIIIARDEQYRAAMERSSTMLRHAIEDYHVARAQRRPMRAIGECAL
jgi:hypothetical protein